MSIHATISAEAQEALAKQKRTSTIYSITIALLLCCLLGIILSILYLATAEKKVPEMISYSMGVADSPEIEKPEITNEVTKKPSAPSAATSVIATQSASALSVPTVDITLDDASLDFGMGEADFGDGLDGFEIGGESASEMAGGFGSSSKAAGTIPGTFYDFKQTADGDPKRNYTVGDHDDYASPVKKFHRYRFSAQGLREHFKADKSLFVRYIAIPFSDANRAPKLFGVQDQVKPAGWLVHYSGKLRSLKTGTYRLVGIGDDYLGVAINGKGRLVAPWSNLRDKVRVAGANTTRQPNHVSPFDDQTFVYGSWFSLREGEEFDVDVAIGENPGGKVGFMLMIEEKDADYKRDANGNPQLPPFAFGKLAPGDKAKLRQFRGYKFDLENIPPFTTVD